MKISVITVCYNCEKEIEQTLKSVLSQSAICNIEYIVVDGSSTDGTLNIINKYLSRIHVFKSEPDKGIYDAMNKAINLSSGNYLIFMNAGDEFADTDTLERVLRYIEESPQDVAVFYGNVVKYKNEELIYCEAESLSLLRYRMPFCHQSCIVKADVMKRDLYDIHYKIAADFNFFHCLYSRRANFSHIPEYIAKYEALNGVSIVQYMKSIHEVADIISHKRLSTWLIDYLINYFRGYSIYMYKTIKRHLNS